MSRTHLITGVTGQDGVLLARRLLLRGEAVVGTVRPDSDPAMRCYLDGVRIVEHDVRDTDGFARLVAEYRPLAIHNLAAKSSVRDSWQDVETTRSINHDAVTGMLAVLAGLGSSAPAFVQASSSEIFGPVPGGGLIEETAELHPVSPYGEAKADAHLAVIAARESGLHATNLVMFGHTSALHAPSFALPRVTRAAAEVSLGRRHTVELHDPTVRRDWGSAADFVTAFVSAVDAPAGDYVLGTGHIHDLGEVVGWALAAAGVPEAPLVTTGEPRPHDFGDVAAAPALAREMLGWEPRTSLRRVIERMVAVDVARLTSGHEQDPGYLEETL